MLIISLLFFFTSLDTLYVSLNNTLNSLKYALFRYNLYKLNCSQCELPVLQTQVPRTPSPQWSTARDPESPTCPCCPGPGQTTTLFIAEQCPWEGQSTAYLFICCAHLGCPHLGAVTKETPGSLWADVWPCPSLAGRHPGVELLGWVALYYRCSSVCLFWTSRKQGVIYILLRYDFVSHSSAVRLLWFAPFRCCVTWLPQASTPTRCRNTEVPNTLRGCSIHR